MLVNGTAERCPHHTWMQLRSIEDLAMLPGSGWTIMSDNEWDPHGQEAVDLCTTLSVDPAPSDVTSSFLFLVMSGATFTSRPNAPLVAMPFVLTWCLFSLTLSSHDLSKVDPDPSGHVANDTKSAHRHQTTATDECDSFDHRLTRDSLDERSW